MSDKIIQPISEDLKLQNQPPQTTPNNQPPASANPPIQPQNVPSGQQVQPDLGPANESDGSATAPATQPQSVSGDASPKPFTMDDPQQVVDTPSPQTEQSASNSPQPFVMGNSPNKKSPTSMANQQATSETDTGNTSAKFIGSQQSAPSAPQAVESTASPAPVISAASSSQDTNSQSTQNSVQPEVPSQQNNPAAAPNLQADGSPAMSQQTGSGDDNKQKLNKSKKLPILIGAGLFIVAVAGFVFGYYIPNQPENMYSRAIDRTGSAIDELVLQATEAEQLDQLGRMQLSGNMKYTDDAGTYTADFSSQYESGTSDHSVNVTNKDNREEEEAVFGFSLITDSIDDSRFPDIFFQIRNVEALGLSGFIPGITEYDSQWIEISSQYLEENVGEFLAEAEDEQLEDITLEDYADAVRVLTQKTTERMFSSGDDGLLELDEFAGDEEINGMRTYRYSVNINQDNAYEYCEEISRAVVDLDLFNQLSVSLSEDELAEQVEQAIDDCQSSVDDIIEDTDIEMWVDRSTRLIHKFRFSEKDDNQEYLEIGQRFNGGDTIDLFFVSNSGERKTRAETATTVNFEDNTSNITVNAENTSDDFLRAYEMTLTIDIQPLDSSITVERPADSVSIETVIEDIIGTSFNEVEVNEQSAFQQNTNDVIRESDMQTLRTGIEAYYTLENSTYPSLQQINDSAFRAEYFAGIDDEPFQDPEGSTSQLASSPALGVYAYSPVPAGCDNQSTICDGFTLYVTLSTGEIIERSNLQGSGFTQTMSRLLR